ncbi:MAG: hypothetical protein IJ273_01410, partial [Alphaproteobacteria bacterium]|nr:hypothetical protein [Alphaproteobacteria bacterium]
AAGSYGSTTAQTASTCSGTCTAGYYCPAGSTSAKQNDCPAGSYCPAGSGSATACGAGKYSAANASSCGNISAGCYGTSASSACPASCAKGTYSTGGASACTNVSAGCYADTTGSTSACPKSCPAGTYGSTTGLTSSTCSGSCTANYYCPAGSTSAKQNGCPTAYPYSAAGAGAITSCYSGTKSRAWSGSQVNGSTPTNCYSVTEWNACSVAACDYVAYANSAGTGDGTIKSGCSSNSSNCTKTVKAVSAKSGYYDAGTSCTACPTSYPNSVDGNEGGVTECYSNTKSRPWSGSQTACSKPTNCATVACNTCSVAACDYVAYANSAGNGDGTIKSGCSSNSAACQQTVKSVTANANHYVDGTTCPACGSSYPYSDGGNISSSYCYTTKTNTGSQIACSKPANSASYSCGTCTVGTCDWRDYNGATDTTCTPDNCTQPVSSVTCNTGYYKSGVTCPACTNKPANSSYTGTATSNSCPWSCNSGYNQTADNQCGQFCGAGITHLHLGNGVSIPLYSSARTSPAINVKWNDTVCYGSLSSGKATGLNVKVGTTTYHAVN